MTDPTPPSWERATLERIALRALDEQRRARHWSTLIRLLWLTLLFLIVAGALGWIGGAGKEPLRTGKHTALVELKGVIGMESRASADKMIAGLNAAFKDKHTQGVVLRINSPGGSPVQSGAINDEIRRLRAKHPDIPLHAVVEDLCASGGYYVAVAAERIYVDKASLVGSIGVIMGGFGFTGAMDKLGIDRRAYTAGDNKDFLDPFAPENPAHKEHANRMLGEIHEQFIKVVRDGRGKRLKESPEIFSGLVWTGTARRGTGARRRLRQRRIGGPRRLQGGGRGRLHAGRELLRAALQAAGRRRSGVGASRSARNGGEKRYHPSIGRVVGTVVGSMVAEWTGTAS